MPDRLVQISFPKTICLTIFYMQGNIATPRGVLPCKSELSGPRSSRKLPPVPFEVICAQALRLCRVRFCVFFPCYLSQLLSDKRCGFSRAYCRWGVPHSY